MTDQEILQEAINRYGEDSQMTQCIEECGELIVALAKFKRAVKEVSGEFTTPDFSDERYSKAYSAVKSEIADVKIMCEQMEMIFGSSRMDEKFKINRLKERLGL